MAAPAKDAVVGALEELGEIKDSVALASEKGWDHNGLVGVIKSLEALAWVKSTPHKIEGWKLTPEGEEYSRKGSPEVQVFNLVKERGSATKDDLEQALGEAGKVGVNVASKNRWISMDKATKAFTALKDAVEDEAKSDLLGLAGLPAAKLSELKKRKLAAQVSTTSYKVTKSENFGDRREVVAEMTSELIQKGTWKDVQFKALNLNASGIRNRGGALHPLMKVRTEVRNVLLLMGFEEMETNQWVESSFWNFDTLYQPQQHPARDAHDTFFMESPAKAQNLPQEYLKAVKEMHERGGRGSTGWNYDWSEDEARKNILRTHTTSVSSRTLHKMAQEYKKTGVFTPRKYFSIDRVFRNETLDATHLAEFHQVEGFIADRNLGLGHLIGVLKEFFLRLGVTGLKFKPAYNPYTEPSMEIFGYHPVLKKTVELGNSGVFRPEMLLPMGLPEDVTVVAWGVGLERTATQKMGIRGLREIFSHEVDLATTKKQAFTWFRRASEE
uniref:phenylalanine--tRNA ligase n=1 Tax=Zooxanthella nutricula TaxID=1333877 RepID=A0A6V0KF54_9DINO